MLTIVFDLDGTLVDTAPDLIHTLNHVLAQEGLPSVPFEAARSMIGSGARIMIQRALAAEGQSRSGPQMDALYVAFITYYAAHIADRSRPFAHVKATLDRLANAGHRLAVCTNKLERLSVRLLHALQLAEYFAAICGQDTFATQKPDPAMLQLTIRRAGGQASGAIMVGDSKTDIQTARAAGVPVIGVDFGYGEAPMTTLEPDRTISSFSELPAAIGVVLAMQAQVGPRPTPSSERPASA